MKRQYGWAMVFSFIMTMLVSTKVYADSRSLEVSRYVIEALVQENGDVSFSETVTFDADGSYNGVYYHLDYKDVEAPTDVSVEEVTDLGKETLEEAYDGSTGTYELFEEDNLLKYKVFLPLRSESKTVVFKYTLPHLIKNYKDTAELNRRVVGANWEIPQSDITVHVSLPQAASKETLRAWGHGGQGTVTIDPDYKGVTWKVAHNNPGSFVEAHMIFPATITAQNTNSSDEDAFDRIVAQEEALIKKAEEQRQNSWTLALVGSIGVGISVIWAWLKGAHANRKRLAQVPYVPEHLFEIPKDVSPAIMDAAIYQELDMIDLTATVMDLVRKKVIRMTDTEPYQLELLPHQQKLLKHEQYVITILFSKIAQKNTIALEEISDYAEEHPDRYERMMTKWKRMVYEAAEPYDTTSFEEGEKPAKTLAAFISMCLCSLVVVFGVLTATTNIGMMICTLLILAVLGVATLFMSGILSKRRSIKGEYEYRRWNAFRQMLLDLSSLDRSEVASIHIWDHMLVYAISLGVAKEVIKVLSKNFPEVLETSVFYSDELGWQWLMYQNTLQHTFASSYNVAVDTPTSTNSGGFGGGFSGGSSFGSGGASGGGGF